MELKKLPLDMFINTIRSTSYYDDQDDDYSQERTKNLKRSLQNAIKEELTNRQRDCLMLYYFERKTQDQIAKQLMINQATVSRHLSYAKNRLEKLLKYVL